MKGKKLYSFWLVWPQDKGVEEEKAAGVEVVRQEDSDDEFDIREEPQVGAVQATAAKVVDPNKPKDLKSVRTLEHMLMKCIFIKNRYFRLYRRRR